ncbi:hypothetical protein O7599_19350 [Streptomyces sp. WMMC500]|uniref:hypothetical protein n=1 Tax=Streptomyces sp. WMMC500 TaxID=3015154 RepID=UPI00248D0EBB|nr:hypothetical protein [Streptomyces sp. WMMC500]WBB57838.1 hypothetical protein O7599_19350 [Streptomyces sp. WMMC500]
MSETDELRRRIDALEAEMDALREHLTTTRAVVAINDRDVAEFKSELRAHKQVLQALRETQLEQGKRIDALDTKVSTGFATVLAAVQAIADRLPEEPAS